MNTRIQPPPSIRDICATLEKHGHEAWCVGGAVRDALLGIETLDWDIATSAHPEQVQKLFRRTVPVGLKFGTVGVLDRDGVLHEVTTFRHDVETDGRHAVVKFGASLEEDLARRDFTINAIALHAERLELRDPFHGRRDLEARIIRAVGDPSERMREDRLRALRALRFAGRFAFAIDPATWDAICESAPHLGRLSMERVKQELEKVMEQVTAPAATLERYRAAGVFAALVPALADAPKARFAAIDHLARPGLRGRPDRRSVRLAALFAEPGKAPARDLEKTLKHLKYSNVEAKATVTWAEAVGAVTLDSIGRGGSFTDAELRRRIARVGRLAVPAVARLLGARAAAEAGGAANDAGGPTADDAPLNADARRAARALYRRALRIAWRDPLTIADLAVDGEDLRAAGVGAGRAMGDTLSALLEAVLDDPAQNTRDALLARVAARLHGGPSAG
ncbi:MAG: CCA tRNA nucleotidyltransferase [Gemmatimonadaceae bacterium]|nr:CCA tRNA nucleotidyltransferase [Gemmatimonadaceae bacterium]